MLRLLAVSLARLTPHPPKAAPGIAPHPQLGQWLGLNPYCCAASTNYVPSPVSWQTPSLCVHGGNACVHAWQVCSPAPSSGAGMWPHRLQVEWEWSDCSPYMSGTIKMSPKDGSNPHWRAFYFANMK